mmetsp:Transcript_15738/g.63379  ORF Transcript_15738/g.63379 Transcript_15738/m.63379 type:complete len:217 (+) Transcript_15738:527-1177(+)
MTVDASGGEFAPYGADVAGASLFQSLGAPDDQDGCPEWYLDSMPSDPLRAAVRASGAAEMSGVTDSMLYIGNQRTMFAWHVEDFFLYSINLLHFGEPKRWWALGPQHAARFEAIADEAFAGRKRECDTHPNPNTNPLVDCVRQVRGVPAAQDVHAVARVPARAWPRGDGVRAGGGPDGDHVSGGVPRGLQRGLQRGRVDELRVAPLAGDRAGLSTV